MVLVGTQLIVPLMEGLALLYSTKVPLTFGPNCLEFVETSITIE